MSEKDTKPEEKETKPEETLDFVDFAVTARKYKTQLTTKYKERKPWTNPSPYDVQSYIPGTIVKIMVKEGQLVKEGDPILILEAMKMQNRIDMPFTARIKKIFVTEGMRIPKEFLMLELAPADER